MNYTIDTIGKGAPNIAIIGSVHGDELIGKKAIKILKKSKFKKGTISFIIANPRAVKKRKRYIAKDLNRSFPGKKYGKYEERLAYELKKELNKFDYVIDIHGTSSDIDNLIIVSKLDKKHKKAIPFFKIKKVARINKKIVGNSSLIHHSKIGITLEYGHDKAGKHYMRAVRDIKVFLVNLGVLSGTKKITNKKVVYYVYRSYKVPKNFKQKKSLTDFRHISKYEQIGVAGSEPYYSDSDFYPLFLGKGRYDDTLAFASSMREKNFI